MEAVLSRLRSDGSLPDRESCQKDLVIVKRTKCYGWSKKASCLYVASVGGDQRLDSTANHVVPYKPAERPFFDVQHLNVDQDDSGTIVIWGSQGAAFLSLPLTPGFTENQGGDGVRATYQPLAEHFFISNPRIRILQVEWNTCSPHSTGLPVDAVWVLNSDNYLRLYTLQDPLVPSYAIPLVSSTPPVSPSRIPTVECLGCSCVSFAQFDSISFMILRGDGDVCRLSFGPRDKHHHHSLSPSEPPATSTAKKPSRKNVFSSTPCSVRSRPDGPNFHLSSSLIYSPITLDNYGLDFVKVAVLLSRGPDPTICPVVVLVRECGMIYHCFPLPQSGSEGHGEPVLHVFENLKFEELEQQQRGSSESSTSPDAQSQLPPSLSLFRVVPDPSLGCRYFLAHPTGIHSVVVSAAATLQRDLLSSSSTDLRSFLSTTLNLPSRVVHLLRTSFSPTQPQPLLALSLLSLGANVAALSAVTQDGTSFRLLTNLRPPWNPGPQPESAEGDIQHTRIPFDEYITEVLQSSRLPSQPLIHVDDCQEVELSPSQLISTLKETCRVIREGYLKRYQLVQSKIRQKANELGELHQEQKREAEFLYSERSRCVVRTQALQQRMSGVLQKQEELRKRVLHMVTQVEILMPTLSEAEAAMSREVENYRTTVEDLQNRLKTLKKRAEHIQKVSTSMPVISTSESSSPWIMRQTQSPEGDTLTGLESARESLQLQSEDVRELVEDVKQLLEISSASGEDSDPVPSLQKLDWLDR